MARQSAQWLDGGVAEERSVHSIVAIRGTTAASLAARVCVEVENRDVKLHNGDVKLRTRRMC